MFNLQKFLQVLDRTYKENPKDLEKMLNDGIRDARYYRNDDATLVLLNELMGYYRVMSNAEGCKRCAQEALALCERMGIRNSDNYATVLLNIATAYRAMGKMEEAEDYYMQALAIYNRLFDGPDYRMATLHNNLSLLYSETGRLKEGKEQLFMAMDLITQLSESKVEIAITHTNLGNLCFQLQEIEEGLEHMQKAVEIFEAEPGKKDVHYASALSGMGQAYYLTGKLEAAKDCYFRALKEIIENYGENDYYRITRKNLELVEDLLERKKAVSKNKMSGLEISRAYYEEYGRSMLEEKYPGYVNRIAVGLCGEGSECLGFDDEYSADHDYGPAFCMWLTEEDYQIIGQSLQQDYESLPGEFMGLPARNTTVQGMGRVGVLSVDGFFRRYTGLTNAPDKEQDSLWLSLNPQELRTVTNGEVFADSLGDFSGRRAAFTAFPERVRLKRLALELGKMAQAGQYNFGRMLTRKDKGAAFLAFNEFISAAIEAGYLLNNQYSPFYKWKMRGMDSFTCLSDLKGRLEELMEDGAFSPAAQEKIEQICGLFVCELRAQHLSESDEMFLEVQKEEVMRVAEHE